MQKSESNHSSQGPEREHPGGKDIILVVDDERKIRALLRMYLEREGFIVEEASDGESALRRLDASPAITLMILDLMLPGIGGQDVCRQIRAGPHSQLPILMLTARNEEIDTIIGLELGADGYITKPFNPRIVVAHVKSILRLVERATSEVSDSDVDILKVGDLTIDTRGREVRIGDRQVALRRKEFDLLEALARQPEVVFKREQLLEDVWGYDFFGQTRTIDVHIASLRRKLKESCVRIETFTGVGYKLTE